MTKFTITFNGTDEQLLAGAVANGYDQEGEQSLDDFICEILTHTSPADFIKEAVRYYEIKLGKDNYDSDVMAEAMANLITITKE